METFGFSVFLLDILPKHDLGPDGELFVRLGRLLHRVRSVLNECGELVPPGRQQELLDLWKSYLTMARPLGSFTPKAHLMIHMILRASALGNPTSYSTFLDESLNSRLKSVLRFVHQANFERLGLLKLNEALSRPALRQRVR